MTTAFETLNIDQLLACTFAGTNELAASTRKMMPPISPVALHVCSESNFVLFSLNLPSLADVVKRLGLEVNAVKIVSVEGAAAHVEVRSWALIDANKSSF